MIHSTSIYILSVHRRYYPKKKFERISVDGALFRSYDHFTDFSVSYTRHLQKIRTTDFQRQILPTHRSIDPYNVLKILATKCLYLVILNCQETQFFSDLM